MVKIYKQTQVDVRPVEASAAVDIEIPTSDNAQRRVRVSITSNTARDGKPIKDEEDFARRYLATQGSVYFRQRRVYPRTFLWRLVNDSTVLEIQSIDVAKSALDKHEANLMLRLDFREAIIPSGVALADTEGHEILNVFVLTTSRRLHTIALRPEFFRRVESIDENIQDWCKSFVPSPLAFTNPHRLHACSTTELFISLDSGALLRLSRRTGDDGSHWSQITFDEKTWGSSLRGYVPWSGVQNIAYDGRSLDPATANAIATTSDHTYVFAVCLNHTLKVWNLATNKLVGTKDLLDRPLPKQQPESTGYFLNPAENVFLRVFNAERAVDGGFRYYVATFTPHEEGKFKFWAVKGGLTTPLIIQDLYPDVDLRPVDPDQTGNMYWTVADFQLRAREEGRHMELWVLWRNNGLYQLYTLHFSFDTLVQDWSNNWTSSAWNSQRNKSPPALVTFDIVDSTEKWLEFLFHPGRYTDETLETALVSYQEAFKPRTSSASFKQSTPLQERLCSAVTSLTSLRRYADDDMDYAKYRSDTDHRWRQFLQVVEEIHHRRLEPLALAYDAYNDQPWLVTADTCALIRECSSTELLLHNSVVDIENDLPVVADRWRHRKLETELGDQPADSCHLLKVAADFRRRLPAVALYTFEKALNSQLFLEPLLSSTERLASFITESNLSEYVSDDIYDNLCAAMNKRIDIYRFPKETFHNILDSLFPRFVQKDSDLMFTVFGARILTNGAQETISHIRCLLHDLLILVVFVEGEVEQEPGSSFDATELFTILISLIKECELLYWLSSHKRVLTGHNPHQSFSDLHSQSKEVGVVNSVLGDFFVVDIKPRSHVNLPQSFTFTRSISDVMSWVVHSGSVAFDDALIHIQCNLIANGNIELASDFLKFQPSNAWSNYIKGRLFVAKSEYDTAALHFQKAAYLLSSGRALGDLSEISYGLLDLLAADKFNNGLPKYYQHILSLFEKAGSFSHIADFASLALQTLESDTLKAMNHSEYLDLRTDVLSRLFHASLRTCQFDRAFSALSRYTNSALQKSALGLLIKAILSAYGSGPAGLEQLLHFPLWLSPNLSSYVDESLLSLARKQTSFSSSLDSAATSRWETSHSPDYHRILHAYRIARNDFRGAAELGYQTVQRLRHARDFPATQRALIRRGNKVDEEDSKRMVEEDDLESKEIRHELVSLINLLACVDKAEAYILVDLDAVIPATNRAASEAETPGKRYHDDDHDIFMDDGTPSRSRSASLAQRRRSSGAVSMESPRLAAASKFDLDNHNNHKPRPRRVIVTLEQLRREYQSELDRVSRIQRGDWEFGVDGDENVDQGAMDENLLSF